MTKEDYVPIHSVEGKLTAKMVRDFLEENGMDSYAEPNCSAMGIGLEGIISGKLAPAQSKTYWKIYVSEQDAQQARELIKGFE